MLTKQRQRYKIPSPPASKRGEYFSLLNKYKMTHEGLTPLTQSQPMHMKSQRNSYKVNFSSNEVNHFRKTVNFTSEEGQQKQYRKTLALKIV